MYIPIWLIVIAVILFLYWNNLKSKQKPQQQVDDPDESLIDAAGDSLEHLESVAAHYKKSLLELEHFDSPRIIDLQDSFIVMEANYFRVKQRYLSDEGKKLELARDWARYVEALNDLKTARVLLDVDMSDQAFDNFEEASKEPFIISDEAEKKFKVLLGKDFQKLLPDYDERQKKAGIENKFLPRLDESWKLYQDSPSYHRMVELREKERKNKKAKEPQV